MPYIKINQIQFIKTISPLANVICTCNHIAKKYNT